MKWTSQKDVHEKHLGCGHPNRNVTRHHAIRILKSSWHIVHHKTYITIRYVKQNNKCNKPIQTTSLGSSTCWLPLEVPISFREPNRLQDPSIDEIMRSKPPAASCSSFAKSSTSSSPFWDRESAEAVNWPCVTAAKQRLRWKRSGSCIPSNNIEAATAIPWLCSRPSLDVATGHDILGSTSDHGRTYNVSASCIEKI